MKKAKLLIGILTLAGALSLTNKAQAQSEIYPGHFDLEEVTLLDGPFKTAMDKNVDVLMQYDVDRLLTPFVRQAGLHTKEGKYKNWTTLHPSFQNWGLSNWSLEGHVGGHYLTALALAYAANHDAATKATLKARIDYMLEVMNDCQRAYDNNTQGMKGFIGGQPINQIWTGLYSGSTTEFAKYGGWVPFYCQHKVLAGLRDAFLYTDGETAELSKQLFKDLSDWSVNVVSKLDNNTMQYVLGWEHGGMNETLIDAYRIFGEAKYLTAAKKYSHADMINGMQTVATTFLNGKHANTQVPKYIGFERICEEDKTASTYRKAAENFWTDVAGNRTVCIGGNSVNEHFLGQDGNAYVNELDGPESCNTNNMLKLSEDLFDRTHNAKYADFYEAAMWNHVLSTQDPVTGGYVYFTPLRPQAYKIYSQVNQGMWCCVGTGMENHSKYGHFIYSHSTEGADTLFVNLFTASELNSEKYGIRQETNFPYEQKTTLTITKPGTFVLAVRKPKWVDNKAASYTCYSKTWAEGEQISIELPMRLSYEQCPNLKEYIAFKYGPILLGARTTKASESEAGSLPYEQLVNEYGSEGRMDHSEKNMTKALGLSTAPLLIGERSKVLERITSDDNSASTLRFTIDVSRPGATDYKWTTLTLEPYYQIHHSRLMNYWYQQTEEEYANSSWALAEQEKARLDERTIDFVATGEQQSEAGHDYDYSTDSGSGMYNDEYYRDAKSGGHIQYTLFNKDSENNHLAIMLRFTTADNGRKGTLFVDGEKLADITVSKDVVADASGFYNQEIPLPESFVLDKDGNVKTSFKVRLAADKGTMCPGLYYLRLTRGYTTQSYYFRPQDWQTGDAGRVPQSKISYDNAANTITVAAGTGNNNVCLGFDYANRKTLTVALENKYMIVRGKNLSTASGKSYLWWLNGTNKGSQVAPTTTKTLDNGEVVIAWDITKSNLDANCKTDGWNLGMGMTIFGLTSTTGTSVIYDINFVNNVDDYIHDITSVTVVPSSLNGGNKEYYALSGMHSKMPQKGVNIVRYSNGNTRKEISK